MKSRLGHRQVAALRSLCFMQGTAGVDDLGWLALELRRHGVALKTNVAPTVRRLLLSLMARHLVSRTPDGHWMVTELGIEAVIDREAGDREAARAARQLQDGGFLRIRTGNRPVHPERRVWVPLTTTPAGVGVTIH